MNSNKQLSYKIHLPNGVTINAKNAHNLEIILSLNVCRVFQSQQIRIEPVYERREALGVTRDERGVIMNKANDFRRRLVTHENDCPCSDCVTL